MRGAMVFKGFRFGMLLQFAVGPICLMVFNMSATHGFFDGLHIVLAVALVDALYIALSCAGVAAVLNKAKVKAAIKLAGCLVLVLFGASTIAGAFGFSILPGISLFSGATGGSLFLQGLLLTASNPLTIVFWSGIFSAQMIENEWSKKQLFFFAAGCVTATVVFMSVIALLGSLLSGFLPLVVVKLLNGAVGIVLIILGIRLVCKKEASV